MLSHALLTVLAATIRDNSPGLIPITLAEVRHLLLATHHRLQTRVDAITWSTRPANTNTKPNYRRRRHPSPPAWSTPVVVVE